MADVGNHNFAVGIKEFVVLYVGRYEHIGTAPDRISGQETARPTANRNLPDWLSPQWGVPHAASLHPVF